MVMPALIAVAVPYLTLDLYRIPLDQSYHSMAALVGLLSLLLPRPARTFQSELASNSIPIALGVVVRWMVLLGALLAIGYATKFSEHYSRRTVLIWALLGSACIVVTTLARQEAMRRLLRDPANAPKTVLAGCTESSLALAQRLGRLALFGMPRIHTSIRRCIPWVRAACHLLQPRAL